MPPNPTKSPGREEKRLKRFYEADLAALNVLIAGDPESLAFKPLLQVLT